ncbi:hypothetical protein PHYC_02697 [Phycisphaerales bacterium]|nr:hypothetical protein PHYC_02697 [Phycisphaerales bacterium]
MRITSVLLAAAAVSLVGVGCEEKKGEEAKKAITDAGDAMKEGATKVADATKDAANRLAAQWSTQVEAVKPQIETLKTKAAALPEATKAAASDAVAGLQTQWDALSAKAKELFSVTGDKATALGKEIEDGMAKLSADIKSVIETYKLQ